MTDLRLPLGDTIFALRAGLLCMRDGQLLAISGEGFDFRYVPGGAVALNEDAAQAAAREWEEETGFAAGPLTLAGIVENFFELQGQRWHEVGLYFRMAVPPGFPEEGLPLRDQPDQFLRWVPVDGLAAARVYPAVLAELLNAPPGTVRHIVNRD